MNINNTFTSVAGSLGRLGDQPSVGASDAKAVAAKGASEAGGGVLSVRKASEDAATEAAGRIRPADEADALKTDALDALIKSVLDFPPPPMPNFDIMSRDTA